MDFESRIDELYLDLPEPLKLAEEETLSCKSGKLLFVGGQLPITEGRLMFKGRIGLELSLDKGISAAKSAFIAALGVVRKEIGSVNKVKRLVHIRLAIATGAEFKDHKKVLSGVTEIAKDIFGNFGKCSSEVIGVASLPQGAAAQVSLVIEI